MTLQGYRYWLILLIAMAATGIVTAVEEVEQSSLRSRELNYRELDDTARLLVQYKSPRGRRAARRCARAVLRDLDDDNSMIIQGNGLCIEELSRDVDIAQVELDEEVSALGSSQTMSYSSIRLDHTQRNLNEIYPWGLDMIQANEVSTGDHNITVCIVDTGIAIGHPDLRNDRITGTDNVMFWGPVWRWDRDVHGHGTHVAGTIAALSSNDIGVAGAGNFHLHIVRALDDDGRGYESDIRIAVEQCIEAGAQIINLSLGGPFMSSRSRRYYTELVEERGIMLVAAAGNDGTRGSHVYPASHPSVIAVGAVYEWESRWTHSNRNSQIELVAPGHNILSTTSTRFSVQVSDYACVAFHIPGTTSESVTSQVAHCDEEAKKCKNAKRGKICIFSKDDTDVTEMIESCEKGGGSGVIIFPANGGDNIGRWSARDGEEIGIPAYAVSRRDGRELLNREDEEATIGDVGDDGIEYSYIEKSGTSMASPHVAASAALLWSNFGNCTNHQIRYVMTKTAHHPNGGDCDQSYGYGIVKTKAAYDWFNANPCSDWDVPQMSAGGCAIV